LSHGKGQVSQVMIESWCLGCYALKRSIQQCK